MTALHTSLIVCAIIFAGAIFGIVLRRVLPERDFSQQSEAVIKLVTGFVVTMTGIVLGMLISSAKSSYDGQRLLITQMSSEIILADRAVAEYGPQAAAIRVQMREYVEAAANRAWPTGPSGHATLQPEDKMDILEAELNDLTPKTSAQVNAKARALAILAQLRQDSWLVYVESDTNRLSIPLLIILVSWIVAIFISFGLYAPPNPTVIVAILLGALAVSAAVLIILEMYSPFSGVMKISPEPIRDAIDRLQH